MGRSSKDRRDIFYRLAKEEGWRARSAYKLLHMDKELKLLQNVNRAIDLCAAPGSWSQVLSQSLRPFENEGKCIVAVDIQDMAPIPGVELFKGDITFDETANKIIEKLGNSKADIVVCDGAPDVTGYHDFDEHLQSDLFMAALNISVKVLQTDGTFLAKIFRSSKEGVQFLFANTLLYFKDVMIAKPRSSRSSSVEAFIVGRGFRLPENYHDPNFDQTKPNKEMYSTMRLTMKKVTCGDADDFDSDTNYPLSVLEGHKYQFDIPPPNLKVLVEGYSMVSKLPVQVPINPPYEEAVLLRKAKKIPYTVNNLVIHRQLYQRNIKLHFQRRLAKLVICGSEMDLIFPRSRIHHFHLSGLLEYIKMNLIEEAVQAFVDAKGVEVGVEILINEHKWCGSLDYEVQDGDIFIFGITSEGNVNEAESEMSELMRKLGSLNVSSTTIQVPRSQFIRTVKLEFEGVASNFVVCQGQNHQWCYVDLHKSKCYGFKFKSLLEYIVDHLLDFVCWARPELFIRNDEVRPGFLVGINGTSIEQIGEYEYELKEGDVVRFECTDLLKIYARNIPRLENPYAEYEIERQRKLAVLNGIPWQDPFDPTSLERAITIWMKGGLENLIKPEYILGAEDVYFKFYTQNGAASTFHGKKLKIILKKSSENQFILRDVLKFIKENVVDREEIIFGQDKIRNEIDFSVNGRGDWKKMGGLEYDVKNGDELQLWAVTRILELHGPAPKNIQITLKFGGGLQNLVNVQKECILSCSYQPGSENEGFTMKELFEEIEDALVIDKPNLIIKDRNIRPGILVLINNSDWELFEDKLNYKIQDRDVITFISSLHGG